MRRGRLIVLLLIACCGPASFRVYDLSTADNGGVPFYPLIAVNKEVRRYDQVWTRVDVVIKEQVAYQKGEKASDTDWREVTLNSSYYLCKAADHTNADQLQFPHDVVKALTDAALSSPEDSKVSAKAVEEQLRKFAGTYCMTDAESFAGSEPSTLSAQVLQDKKLTLISVERSTDQVASPQQSYINVTVPRGGTANADVKLDARGTLAEAIGQKQDQLPAAVISAISGIGAATVTGIAGVAAASVKSNTFVEIQTGHPDIPLPEKPKPGDHVISSIALTTAVKHRVYAVTMLWPVSKPPEHHDGSGGSNGGGSGTATGSAAGDMSWPAFDMTPNTCLTSSPGAMKNCVVSIVITDDAVPTPTPPAPAKAASDAGK